MAVPVPPERPQASLHMGLVAIGDAAMIAVFVAAGEIRHGGTLLAGVQTFAQFGIGWIVAALLLSAYTERGLSSPRYAAGLAIVTWTLAAVLGQGIRLVTEASAAVAPAFVLVSIAVGGFLLGGWRAVVASRFA